MMRFVLACALCCAAGCGTIGPPIPPEELGVAAKLEKEKARAAQQPAQPKEPEKDDDRPEDQSQELSLPR